MTILTKVLLYALGILLAVALVFNGIQFLENKSLHSDITTLTNSNTELKTNLENCSNSLNSQNSAIKTAGDKAKDDQTKIDNLTKQITQKESDNKKLVNTLTKVQAPKTCDAATKYLKDGLGDFQ